MPHTGNITSQKLPGAWVVVLRGEHDLSTAPAFEEELDRLLVGGASIVVDLSQATFIDSSILRTIYNANAAARRAALAIALAAPPGSPPRRLTDLVGFNDTIHTFDSREAALSYLQQNT